MTQLYQPIKCVPSMTNRPDLLWHMVNVFTTESYAIKISKYHIHNIFPFSIAIKTRGGVVVVIVDVIRGLELETNAIREATTATVVIPDVLSAPLQKVAFVVKQQVIKWCWRSFAKDGVAPAKTTTLSSSPLITTSASVFFPLHNWEHQIYRTVCLLTLSTIFWIYFLIHLLICRKLWSLPKRIHALIPLCQDDIVIGWIGSRADCGYCHGTKRKPVALPWQARATRDFGAVVVVILEPQFDLLFDGHSHEPSHFYPSITVSTVTWDIGTCGVFPRESSSGNMSQNLGSWQGLRSSMVLVRVLSKTSWTKPSWTILIAMLIVSLWDALTFE